MDTTIDTYFATVPQGPVALLTATERIARLREAVPHMSQREAEALYWELLIEKMD